MGKDEKVSMNEDKIKNMNTSGLIFLNRDCSKRFPSYIVLKIVNISNTGHILNFTFLGTGHLNLDQTQTLTSSSTCRMAVENLGTRKANCIATEKRLKCENAIVLPSV